MFGLADLARMRRNVIAARHFATADLAEADYARELVRQAREQGFKFALGASKADLAEHYEKQRQRAERIMAKAKNEQSERYRAARISVG